MMNIPANKAAGKVGGVNLTFRGPHADTTFANTTSVIQLNMDNVVADNDVVMSIANLSKGQTNAPTNNDGS